MNEVTKAILATIAAAANTIQINSQDVTAIHNQTNERFIVRFDDDIYVAAVELAEQMGIELDDG